MPTAPDPESKAQPSFDPDDFRMSIGDHLEELRTRVLRGFLGLFVAVIVCMLFGERVIVFFCAPLVRELLKHDINPQTYYTEITSAFMTYLKISLICALALAGPWMLYQLWCFVASGLYPHERKTVTKYIPLSIGLLTLGMVFVYVLVLPWTIRFLLDFGGELPQPLGKSATTQVSPENVLRFPEIPGDPEKPLSGQYWFNTDEGRLKLYVRGQVRAITLQPTGLTAPMIGLSDYIDLVIVMMVTFGLAFQLPLVVMAVVAIGVVDTGWLRRSRRYVYFAMTIIAAIMAPADVVTAMLALLFPLILLYELGIVLSVRIERRRARAAAASDA